LSVARGKGEVGDAAVGFFLRVDGEYDVAFQFFVGAGGALRLAFEPGPAAGDDYFFYLTQRGERHDGQDCDGEED
jgi:hypothetical protein